MQILSKCKISRFYPTKKRLASTNRNHFITPLLKSQRFITKNIAAFLLKKEEKTDATDAPLFRKLSQNVANNAKIQSFTFS